MSDELSPLWAQQFPKPPTSHTESASHAEFRFSGGHSSNRLISKPSRISREEHPAKPTPKIPTDVRGLIDTLQIDWPVVGLIPVEVVDLRAIPGSEGIGYHTVEGTADTTPWPMEHHPTVSLVGNLRTEHAATLPAHSPHGRSGVAVKSGYWTPFFGTIVVSHREPSYGFRGQARGEGDSPSPGRTSFYSHTAIAAQAA